MEKKSGLAVLAAGCLWGSMGIFVRRFDSCGVSSMSIVAVRAVFTAVILAAVLFIFDRQLLKVRLKDLWIFIGCGLCSLVFFNFCYFKAITVMPLSVAAILLYTSPIFVMIFSAVFFKEKFTVRKVIAAGISMIGLCFVTGAFSDAGAVSLKGLLLGLGSAVGYALYSIFSRFAINRGYSPLTMTFYPFVTAAVGSLILADTESVAEMYKASPMMILFSVLFAAAVSVAPYFLYSWGLKGLENGKAAVIACAEPVAAAVFGVVCFGETLSVMNIAGIVLVLAGIALSMGNQQSSSEISSD